MTHQQQVPHSDESAYESPVDTDTHVANNTTNSTVAPYLYTFCRGSAKRVKFSTHIDSRHFFTNSPSILPQCVIDSGATHHMWNDPSAFISFHKEEHGGYVRIANNQKIPIVGYGTIRVQLGSYTIQLDDVFYVPSLRDSLFSVRQHRRCNSCSFVCDNDGCKLNFPLFSIPVNDDNEMIIATTPIAQTSNKVHWSTQPNIHANVALIPKSPTPRLRPSDKPNPCKAQHRRITNHELHRYLGFRQLSNLQHFKSSIQDTVTIVNAGEIPKDISDYTTIHRNTQNKTTIPRPTRFFEVAHMDIGYGDAIAPGGYKFVLLIVDRKTRYSYLFGLKDTKAQSIVSALKELLVIAGKLPTTIYTDFDPKILSSKVTSFCHDNLSNLLACPEGQQNQNGLVERKWQTLVHMARRYLTDKQMPRQYWYWALRHSNRISNIFPLRCDQKITTSHELVFSTKPDYRQLFRLFSTAYLSHQKDNTHPRTATEPHTLQGIAVGFSDKANGMEIYNPSTKQLYTTTVYKLDESNETRNHFNLHYDGAMFFGLFSAQTSQTSAEQFPPGTKVRFTKNDSTTLDGFVIAVSDMKISDDTATYPIHFEDGTTESVPASLLPKITTFDDNNITQPSIFPSWIKHGAKCTFEYNNTQLTGVFCHNPDNTWDFHSTNRSGVAKHKYPLPNLNKTFHSLQNLGILRPGWNVAPMVPTAYHVSARDLQNPCPKTLKEALDPTNPDKNIWTLSYEEEYKGIYNCAVYDVIDKEEYSKYHRQGITAIPTMCILTIKNKDGHPDRAKSRIVVLGNQDRKYYEKSDKYAPVLSQNQLRLLVAIAISKQRILRQGDVKNAFCNGVLPLDETTICLPPKNCPFSKPNTYWKLKKTLYGLAKSPVHWFHTIEKIFHSMGLKNHPNSPCLFTGTLLDGKPPIYIGLYVDDFCYFSTDDDVEAHFCAELNKHFEVTWDAELEWFLGIRFHWKYDTNNKAIKCHLSQEAFIMDLLTRTQLHGCNTSATATPFRRGLPVDTITDGIDLTDNSLYSHHRTQYFQEIMGCLNWLSISTRPDITSIVTLLAAHQASPLQGHLNASLHVVRYLASTLDNGVTFTHKPDAALNSFLHFPLASDLPTGMSDSNWGPMDASKPKRDAAPIERDPDSFRSVSGSLIFFSHGPVSWGAQRQTLTALSSCEAEINATNETVKSILEIRILLRNLNLPLTSLVPVYNDNKGAVDWCKGTITKKTRHIDLQENHVKENINRTLSLSHIPGKTNLADIFTKEYKDSTFYLRLRDLLVPSLQSF